MPGAVPLIKCARELETSWGNYLERLVRRRPGVLAAAVRWHVPHSCSVVQVCEGVNRKRLDGFLSERKIKISGGLRARLLPFRHPVVGLECGGSGSGLYVLARDEKPAREVRELLGGAAEEIGRGLAHSSGVLSEGVIGAVLEAILGGIHFPAVVVRRDGRVVFANGVARALERSGKGPFAESEDGGLEFGRKSSDQAYSSALAEVWSGECEVRRIVEETILISVRRVDVVAGVELAVVTFRELGGRIALRICEVGRLLGLTPAQSKVALAIFDGKTVREFAAESKTSVTTVRWHLQEVLHRVGCKSQVDLVRFLWQLI